MNFFQAQDHARKNTKWLVLLFLLAVVAIIVTVYFAVLVGWAFSNTQHMAQPVQWWNPELFAAIGGVTTLVIILGSIYKIVALSSGGGASVAEALGARQVSRSTTERLEKRLLNVVDEMAIASGLTVPKVYIMDDENGINAFAAGTSPSNAVVAVTRGCLEKLSRDELQGVIAHEFSHIFNGDMRINIRLMGILHGILLIALIGRGMLRGSSRRHSRSSKSSGGAVALGLALFLAGYIGVFFGRIIKAAVSRQREFLADASAVQYTRNPTGIAGALKKIGGFSESAMTHPNAEQASHMFFGSGLSYMFSLLATHPPIEQRIQRLDPAFSAEVAASTDVVAGVASEATMGFAAGQVAMSPTGVSNSIGNVGDAQLGYAHQILEKLPEELWLAVRDAEGARCLVFALLLAVEKEPLEALKSSFPEMDAEQMKAILSMIKPLRKVGREVWLPLLELAIPALEELPSEAVEVLPREVEQLIQVDGRVTLFEFVLMAVLRHALEERSPNRPKHQRDVRELRNDITLLLSLLCYAGSKDEEQCRAAFDDATRRAPLDGEWRMLEKKSLSIGKLDAALARLGESNFRFKEKLIEACVMAIAHDGQATVVEAELLRAIGARLDCPIPPILPGELAAA